MPGRKSKENHVNRDSGLRNSETAGWNASLEVKETFRLVRMDITICEVR